MRTLKPDSLKLQFPVELQAIPFSQWPKEEFNLYHKLWKRSRPEQTRAASKRYRLRNLEQVKQALANWRSKDPERTKALARKYNANQYRLKGDRLRERNRAYLQIPENKKKNLERTLAWQKANRERRREIVKKWADNNRPKILARVKKRLATDLNFYLRNKLRARIRMAFTAQGHKKSSITAKLLGCEFEVFRQWLESQFDENMTWDNCGKYWVIDHVTPVVAFDLTQESEQLRAFHYTNCQPLEKRQNIIKSDSMPCPSIVIVPNLKRPILEQRQRLSAPPAALVG